MQPSSSAAKKGASAISKGKMPKSFPLTGPSGRVQAPNRNSAGALGGTEATEALLYDHLIGRKVMTRWPADNNFYEAVITDYKPLEGVHLLVYDINTNHETWEWVNLQEIVIYTQNRYVHNDSLTFGRVMKNMFGSRHCSV